jgi:Glycosyltransferase
MGRVRQAESPKENLMKHFCYGKIAAQRAVDWLINLRVLVILRALLLMAVAYVSRKDAKKIRYIFRAYDLLVLSQSPWFIAVLLRCKVAPYIRNEGTRQDSRNERFSSLKQAYLDKTIVLKAPQNNGEKGIMLIMAELNWKRLFTNSNISEIEKKYDFILSAGWFPTDYYAVALALSHIRGTLFVQACNRREIPFLERFSPRIKCLETIGCDWIKPDFYTPKPYYQRDIDILMVANWAPFKRHWHLFEAIRKMKKNLRVVLIGQPDNLKSPPYTINRIREQAALFGVKQQIEYLEDASIEKVTSYQCNSRISIILSRHEGCCVAIAESLFADSPVAMLAGALVGSADYINKKTGILLRPRKMHYQLEGFLDNGAGFKSREWAINNISSFASCRKLNELLKKHAQSEGLPWTKDIKPICWRPYPTYIDETDYSEVSRECKDLSYMLPGLFRY